MKHNNPAGEPVKAEKPRWLVKFMRRGFEPPMPFGKTREVVVASSRNEAIEIVRQSGMVSGHYPKVTASKTELEVSYAFRFTVDAEPKRDSWDGPSLSILSAT